MPDPEPVDLTHEPVPLPRFHNDPFNPILFDAATQLATITREQEEAVRTVLLLSSSDTRFAQKAADALKAILLGGASGGPAVVPVITSIEPATGVVGAVNLKVKCKGTGFDASSVIYINGNPVATSFTSATEVSTNVNLTNAGMFQFTVKNGTDLLSNSMPFTVTGT